MIALVVVVIAWCGILLTPVWTFPVSRDTMLIAVTLVMCTLGLTNVLRQLHGPAAK